MTGDLESLTGSVLELTGDDQAQVIVTHRDTALTRFANNEIHQNVSETSLNIRVLVRLDGGRTGVATTDQVDTASLRRAVDLARETAKNQPGRDDLPPLPSPAAVDPLIPDEATAEAAPEERAEMVASICEPAEAAGVRSFGALSTGVVTYAVANSNGLFMATPRAVAELRIVTMSDGGSGYADRASGALAGINAREAGAEAIEKSLRTRGAEPIEAGVYPVVLEEYAVAQLVSDLSYMGFSGLAVEEGRSFMRLGERITGANVNIWDDGNNAAGVPMPFDFEGVPRKRVDLIRDGVANAVVHDLASATRAGVEPTGHGLPAPNPWGAYAMNLFMAGGSAPSREALVEGIERGVWVTRLHYTNPYNPRQSGLTGMTRDGTFLIENGKVTRPIKDMRFTQSVMEAFDGLVAATRETRLQPGDDYEIATAARVPAVALQAFNFTSVTR